MIKLIKKCIAEIPEVAAAYLFGSAAGIEQTVNDLDILVLLSEEANRLETQLTLMNKLSNLTGFRYDRIDIVIFDPEEVEPEILQKAINQGILLKNDDPDFLGARIEEISDYFMKNEPMIFRAKRLRREKLEAFCESG